MGADHVAGGLGLLRGDVDGPAPARWGDDRLERRPGVAAVVLEGPVGGAPRDARHGDHVAVEAGAPEVARQLEAAGAGLVDEADGRPDPGERPPGDVTCRGAPDEPRRADLGGVEADAAERHRARVLVEGDDARVARVEGILSHQRAAFPVCGRLAAVCMVQPAYTSRAREETGWGALRSCLPHGCGAYRLGRPKRREGASSPEHRESEPRGLWDQPASARSALAALAARVNQPAYESPGSRGRMARLAMPARRKGHTRTPETTSPTSSPSASFSSRFSLLRQSCCSRDSLPGAFPRCLRSTRAMTRRTRSQPRAPSLSSKAQTSCPPQNETKGLSLCLT